MDNIQNVLNNTDARKSIKETLMKLGFKPELDGFDQICSAIMLEISKVVRRKNAMYAIIAAYSKAPSDRAVFKNISRAIGNVDNIAQKISLLFNRDCQSKDYISFDPSAFTNGYTISIIAAYFEISGKLNPDSFIKTVG